MGEIVVATEEKYNRIEAYVICKGEINIPYNREITVCFPKIRSEPPRGREIPSLSARLFFSSSCSNFTQ